MSTLMPLTKDIPEAVERWKGQVEGLTLYSSCQDAVGPDGEAIEFEWKNFPGCSSLSILEEIQQDLEKRKMKPEGFTDPTAGKTWASSQ